MADRTAGQEMDWQVEDWNEYRLQVSDTVRLSAIMEEDTQYADPRDGCGFPPSLVLFDDYRNREEQVSDAWQAERFPTLEDVEYEEDEDGYWVEVEYDSIYDQVDALVDAIREQFPGVHVAQKSINVDRYQDVTIIVAYGPKWAAKVGWDTTDPKMDADGDSAASLEEFCAWAEGEVFMVMREEKDEDGEWYGVDSVGGFIGEDFDANGLNSYASDLI